MAELPRYKMKDGRTFLHPIDTIADYRTFCQPVFRNNFGSNFFGPHREPYIEKISDAWKSFAQDNSELVRLLEYLTAESIVISSQQIERVKDDFRNDVDMNTDPVLAELEGKLNSLKELYLPAMYTAYRHLQHHVRNNVLLTG